MCVPIKESQRRDDGRAILGAVNLKLDRHKHISLDARFLECSVVGDLVELWPQMAMGEGRKTPLKPLGAEANLNL